VVIIRLWKDQAKRGIERAAARFARGESWFISIEGARTPDGRLLPYNTGDHHGDQRPGDDHSSGDDGRA
jgi:1-acyl-sn-glycerol-3-phosphate acyltransferase